MTLAWCAVRGSVRHEARMAARGRVLWLSLLPLMGLAILLALASPAVAGVADPVGRVGTAVLVVNAFTTAGLGVALAGRLTEHSRPGLTEVLDSTPGGRTVRLAGVLTGGLAVALTPVAGALVLLGAIASAQARSVLPLATAASGVVTVIVPAALVITTFAGLLGLLLPVVLARVLVVAAWFWATLCSPLLVPVPTPTGTVLSPLGGYQSAAWLGVKDVWANRDLGGVLSPPPDTGSALLNVVVVLVFAVLFFLAARLVMAWQADRRGTRYGAER